jgi:hypothetical protein
MFQLGKLLRAQHAHWQVVSARDEVLREGEQHNLLLNQASDTLLIGNGFHALNRHVVVGTSSVAPDGAQTGLGAEVARTGAFPTGQNETLTRVGDGIYEITRTRQFAAGALDGRNLTEWGFSPSNAPGNNLAVRELFRDAQGNPITLTLEPGQALRITHKMRVTFAPTVAQSVNLTIDNLGVKPARLWVSGYQNADYVAINALLRNVYLQIGRLYTPGGGSGYTDWTASADAIACNHVQYVPGSKRIETQRVTWDTNAAVGECFGFGMSAQRDLSDYYGHGVSGIVLKFDEGHQFTKDNEHKLISPALGVSWS